MISLFINNTMQSSKIVSPLGNQVTVNFSSPIILDDKKKYELRLLNANVVYCMPNVTSANNELWYTINGSTRCVTFDDGLYSLDDINSTLSFFTYQTLNGNESGMILFEPDQATSKLYISFSRVGITVDCTASHNILGMLGFPASMGVLSSSASLYYRSTNQAQLNSLQNILIKCDITGGSYVNGDQSNVIASVTPNVDSYSTISFFPIHPTRCAIFVKRIDRITLTLTDQNGVDVDMGTSQGTLEPELWSVLLTITEHEPLL